MNGNGKDRGVDIPTVELGQQCRAAAFVFFKRISQECEAFKPAAKFSS